MCAAYFIYFTHKPYDSQQRPSMCSGALVARPPVLWSFDCRADRTHQRPEGWSWKGLDGASKWTPLPARRARRGVHSLNYPACTAQVTTPRPTATVRVAPQDCSLHCLTRGGAQLVLARHVVHSTSQLSRTQAGHGADRCDPFASCCMHAAREFGRTGVAACQAQQHHGTHRVGVSG